MFDFVVIFLSFFFALSLFFFSFLYYFLFTHNFKWFLAVNGWLCVYRSHMLEFPIVDGHHVIGLLVKLLPFTIWNIYLNCLQPCVIGLTMFLQLKHVQNVNHKADNFRLVWCGLTRSNFKALHTCCERCLLSCDLSVTQTSYFNYLGEIQCRSGAHPTAPKQVVGICIYVPGKHWNTLLFFDQTIKIWYFIDRKKGFFIFWYRQFGLRSPGCRILNCCVFKDRRVWKTNKRNRNDRKECKHCSWTLMNIGSP